MQKTAIIVPCHNEAKRLNVSAFIEETKRNSSLTFIFVNDGSTDETPKILGALCRDHPAQMWCVDLERNRGKAEAVRQGFLSALKSEFVNIGYWDADLATPLDVVGKFCEILETSGAGIVMGSRVQLLGRRIERSTTRHYLGRVFATFASWILRLPVYDTQCGAKVFKKNEDLGIIFGRPFEVNWVFDVEILARFLLIEKDRGRTPLTEYAVEYPLERWTDVPGSKIKLRDFIVGFVELFKISLILYVPGRRRGYIESLWTKPHIREGAQKENFVI